MSPTETQTLERANPLKNYTPKTVESWKEWLETWDATELAELRHHLLHIGLDLIHRDELEAIPFYLRVADGHLHHGISSGSGDYGEYYWPGDHRPKSAPEIRGLLASKAFTVLVNRFFGTRSNEHRNNVPHWAGTIFLGEILEDVVWFLRCEPRHVVLEDWGPRNFTTALTRPENERATEAMTSFIIYLARLAFNRRFFDETIVQTFVSPDRHEEVRERLVAVRPQLIEPLAYIDQLNLLVERGVEIDDAWLAQLAKIAGVNETTSVADSVMRHNTAAMVLQNVNTIRHGQKVAKAQAKAVAAQAEADELQNAQK